MCFNNIILYLGFLKMKGSFQSNIEDLGAFKKHVDCPLKILIIVNNLQK